jgi:ATP-binding protein involved in chromosome partitioning
MTSPSLERVNAALATVNDPEIRRPITEIGMVDDVSIGDDGQVGVTVLLTVSGCPMKDTLTRDVTNAVSAVEGVSGVDVTLGVMSDEQRQELQQTLRGGQPAKEIPFARPDSLTQLLAVASGKGGVGKSSLTVNLAIALRAQGHEVGIIDADIYGFSIPGMLGIDQRPVTFDGMIVPPVAHGVKTISIGYFLDDEGAVMWRGPMLHRALEQFMTDVHWGGLDYLLIDMPPGTGDIAISLGQLFTEAGRRVESIIVTTPNQAAQRVAERAAAVAHRMKMEIAGVVENMSYRVCPCCGERDDVFGSGGGQSLADKVGVPLLAQIPLEPAVRSGGDEGLPLLVADPETPAAQAITELARQLVRTGKPDPAQRMTRRLQVL